VFNEFEKIFHDDRIIEAAFDASCVPLFVHHPASKSLPVVHNKEEFPEAHQKRTLLTRMVAKLYQAREPDPYWNLLIEAGVNHIFCSSARVMQSHGIAFTFVTQQTAYHYILRTIVDSCFYVVVLLLQISTVI